MAAQQGLDSYIVGTCMTMCPTAEIMLRQREGLVHPLEMRLDASGKKTKYGDSKQMVKAYTRSAAGQVINPASIRPLPVLAKSVNFLLTSVCSRQNTPWSLIYSFVSDRLRAVRQDVIVQGLGHLNVVQVLLPTLRFFVYAQFKMSEHDLCDFDPHLNTTQLRETLQTLLAIYKDNEILSANRQGHSQRRRLYQDSFKSSAESGSFEKSEDRSETLEKVDRVTPIPLEINFTGLDNPVSVEEDNRSGDKDEIHQMTEREEIEAINLLVNLGSAEAVTRCIELREEIRSSPMVQICLDISLSWILGNYIRVLKQLVLLPPILACAIYLHITKVQRYALGVMSVAYSSKGLTWKLSDVQKLLLFPSTNAVIQACQSYGVIVKEGNVSFAKGGFKWDAPLVSHAKLPWLEKSIEELSLSEFLLQCGTCHTQ
ncbi:SAC3 domain-containing protein 1 isoform X1 [Oratosquilla oratoria]|uniref:SAC3 domain-containing protein 1 isoform X1 n=1 Tax=Oratosquilla oratoria TaxID=337810 RepID=UPI003F762044